MLRIISHIENLLLSHDCVIVPGIGGFVTHFEEAFFSEDGREIFPPYCSVSFNAHLSDKEDKYGLLTQSYMTAYDINYPKALSLVNEDVAAMREQLRKNMELQISTIGTLQLTLNYSLLFTPSQECGVFAKELYGLVQAKIGQKNPTLIPSKEENTPSNPPLRKCSVSDSALEETPTREKVLPHERKAEETAASSKPIIERDIDGTHYIIRVSKSAVRYALTTVAAALLYFVFTITPSVSPMTDSNVQQAGIVKLEKRSSSALNTTSSPSPMENTLAPESAKPYTLVLASAVSKKGAQHMVDELKEDGFAQAKVMDDNGMTRVIYSAYPSEDDAYRAAKTLRQQHKDFHSAWVMEINN